MKNLFVFAALLISALSYGQTFTPVDEESKIHFVVKNFGINTGGDISGMKGTMKFNAKKPASASFDVTANVSTIDTDNEKRDTHLNEADYFDTEKYPQIRLVSTQILPGKDLKNFIFYGKLIIKNISKNVVFPFTAESKKGLAIFKGNFEIIRSDFGIGKSSATLSDKVKVSLTVSAKAG